MCSIATFVDRTDSAFQKEGDYWYSPKHSGFPYDHENVPVFVDLNGDGRLDLFNSMHGHLIDEKGYHRMELAENQESNDFISLHQVSHRININDSELAEMDPHGQNVIDLDGDGILDIYITSGGGKGAEKTLKYAESRDNFLFWGRLDEEDNIVFEGGRDTARQAGVHMRNGRGRITYMLDVDGDGKLDMFALQDRRVSNVIAPGVMLMNTGDRSWTEDTSMREYARAMLLTDADGDGKAEELMLHRGFCFPQREGPNDDHPEYGIYDDEVKEFCRTRPVGSTAIYKYNKQLGKMQEITTKYKAVSAQNDLQPSCCPHGAYSGSKDCHAISIASGDFDGDTIADQILLFTSKLVFHFSSERERGELPIGGGSTEVVFPNYCITGRTVRVVDLNNDGDEEILVMCENPGTFLVYVRGDSHRDWVLDDDCNKKGAMGDIFDVDLSKANKATLMKQCDSDYKFNEAPTLWPKMQNYCDDLKERKKLPNVKTEGLSLIDLNNDGFLDAVVSHDFGYLRFFENTPSLSCGEHKYIVFRLKTNGKTMNEYAIGSTVILYMKQGGRKKTQFREVSSHQHVGDKYGNKEDRIIFGLGKKWKPQEVVVRWPGGTEDKYQIQDWEFTGTMEEIVLNPSSTTDEDKSKTTEPRSSGRPSPISSSDPPSPSPEVSTMPPSLYPSISSIPSDTEQIVVVPIAPFMDHGSETSSSSSLPNHSIWLVLGAILGIHLFLI